MRSALLARVLGFAAVIGILFVFLRGKSDHDKSTEPRIEAEKSTVTALSTPSDEVERTPLGEGADPRRLMIALRTPQGDPVESADISIVQSRRSALCELMLQESHSADTSNVVWRGVSTAKGTCELPFDSFVGDSKHVVWIVKQGFKALCLDMRQSLAAEAITMDPDEAPQLARVVAGDVWRDSEIVVAQRLASVSFHPESWADVTVSTIEIAHVCQEARVVRLIRSNLSNTIQARAADVASAVVSVSAGRDVTLSLSGFFSAAGAIKGSLYREGSAGFVEYCTQRGGLFSVIARVRPDSSGSFYFAQIPVIFATSHSFRFISNEAAAASVYVDQPQYGDRISLSLAVTPAQLGQFEVLGPDQRPIPGATVNVFFESARNPRELHTAITDISGRATVMGLPSERCIAYATAPGFFTSSTISLWPHYLAGRTQRIEMQQSGAFSGRVLRNNQPVEAFDIWYLSPSIGAWVAERFESTSDGAFILREVPTGAAEMFASADALGQSDVLNVEVATKIDLATPVVIHILSGMSGRGVVVDSVTGRPLEGAQVQIWTCAGGTTVSARHVVKVDPLTGVFKTDALSAGTARVHAQAAGYAGRTVSAFGNPGADVDFGVVRLDGTQSLKLHLHPDGDLRLDFCSASVSTDLVSPTRLFDEAGWLDVGPVVAGPCRVDLVRADRYEEGFDFVLEAGQRVVELPVRVAPGVNVVLEEGAPEGAALVRVHHQDETGWGRDTLGNLDGGREVALPVAAAGVREVEVLDASSVRLLRREVTAEERAAGTVRIGAAEELLVRVVDRKRAPLEGTTVLVRRVGGPTDVALDARTDADGLARLAGVGWAQVEVLAFHPQRGVVPSVRAEAAEHRSKPLEIELDAEGRWAIDVRDDDTALSGVQVRFLDPRHNAGRSVSDAAGRATSLPFARGRFRAEAGERGYWPAALEVEFQGADLLSTLQVRRTGSAALEVRSSSTPDVRDIELDLESLEFRERASDWIAAGKASADGGLQPDKEGRVRIDGLPRGKYRWRAARAGEVVASGELEVPPHGVVSEKLLVP